MSTNDLCNYDDGDFIESMTEYDCEYVYDYVYVCMKSTV